MKSIVVTYPGYQSLPKGVKRMLVVSEDYFFCQPGTATGSPEAAWTLHSRRAPVGANGAEPLLLRGWRQDHCAGLLRRYAVVS